jgi:hypothetical protein
MEASGQLHAPAPLPPVGNDQTSRFFRDSPEFSFLVPDFFQRKFGTQICPGFGRDVTVYPGLENFFDIREFLKVWKLSWSYLVSLTSPIFGDIVSQNAHGARQCRAFFI